MQFVNDTSYPALHFEGIDQLNQSFHVVVMRVTCTWDKTGLLITDTPQDPLCMNDILVDNNNLMGGVLEESDLCHYKPKCDVLVVGHAYAPQNHSGKMFNCQLKVQTPNKWLYNEPIYASKYLFANTQGNHTQPKQHQFVKGTSLIDKTLNILAPSVAFLNTNFLADGLNYSIEYTQLPNKTPLNPQSSFGGYHYIEKNDKALDGISSDQRLPKDAKMPALNPHHGKLAYFTQNPYNPYGTGFLDSAYAKAVMPKQIKLPCIHHPNHHLTAQHLSQMSRGELSGHTFNTLTAGFGVRPKTHPDRHRFLGEIDDDYLQSKTPTPKGFDFAIWNSAYPDQQTNHLVGNEWITLINLCSTTTCAAQLDDQGNTVLQLYLPELLAYLVTTSYDDVLPASEVPMKLDTVMIRPDEHKVHLVWRGIIAGAYNPNVIVLQTADRQTTEATLATHFTQKGTIIRPHEEKTPPCPTP